VGAAGVLEHEPLAADAHDAGGVSVILEEGSVQCAHRSLGQIGSAEGGATASTPTSSPGAMTGTGVIALCPLCARDRRACARRRRGRDTQRRLGPRAPRTAERSIPARTARQPARRHLGVIWWSGCDIVHGRLEVAHSGGGPGRREDRRNQCRHSAGHDEERQQIHSSVIGHPVLLAIAVAKKPIRAGATVLPVI
jgi:hypothetical protein